jgi:hypothetical protein
VDVRASGDLPSGVAASSTTSLAGSSRRARRAVGLIAEEGFDPEFGARPLRRTIQRRMDNELASMVLSGSLNPGDKVVVSTEEGNLGFEVLGEAEMARTTSGDEAGR